MFGLKPTCAISQCLCQARFPRKYGKIAEIGVFVRIVGKVRLTAKKWSLSESSVKLTDCQGEGVPSTRFSLSFDTKTSEATELAPRANSVAWSRLELKLASLKTNADLSLVFRAGRSGGGRSALAFVSIKPLKHRREVRRYDAAVVAAGHFDVLDLRPKLLSRRNHHTRSFD